MTSKRFILAFSIGSCCSVLLTEAFAGIQQFGASSLPWTSRANPINPRATCSNHAVSSSQICRRATFLTARKRRTTRKEDTEEEIASIESSAPSSVDKPKVVEPVATPVVEAKQEDEDVEEGEEEDDDEYEYYYEEEEEEDEKPVAAPVVSRGDDAVSLQVQDIRALTGRAAAAPAQVTESKQSSPTFSSSAPVPKAASSGYGSSRTDDALEQLLADAKMMQMEEKSKGGADDEAEGEFSISSVAKNAISTIVTIDFFVVCAFLLWFLAGVFSSYVLDNDGVQIAFNGIFESAVQPALGILMIGTIAGGVLKDEEEGDM